MKERKKFDIANIVTLLVAFMQLCCFPKGQKNRPRWSGCISTHVSNDVNKASENWSFEFYEIIFIN